MSFDPRFHGRCSRRLAGYDYAGYGIYFVTVCVAHRRPAFGRIVAGWLQLSAYGRLVHDAWAQTTQVRPEVTLDSFVVMPDHFYAVVWLPERTTPHSTPAGTLHRPPRSLGSLMAGWKATVTSQINQSRASRDWAPVAVWQRNYYDHIVRHEDELNAIRQYVHENPLHWHEDRHFD